ncbi:MAG: UDP-N-acetylmuramoyl-tripeptide--D-alanyl-D-alanine ligase [Chloroflexia bacterium]|nr:UDP-N-acetylmuramoyl-tripeptide--D-alanyl-D-alanine ligase [Chloroflexia bacterium]
MPLTLAEILEATDAEVRGGGHLPADLRFPQIERDSRQVAPGDLFIAIRGEVHDGHQFVAEAAAKGAAAALVSKEWAAGQTEPPLPLLVVEAPVDALQVMAGVWRNRLDDLIVVGITGSIGKTSTKEVVASVLGGRYRTYRNPGNLNNEIGLPLSVLAITPDTEAAVLEMGGAYAFGELRLLAEIARPRLAVVTNVFPVHLERMGSIEAIAETKAELVEALPDDGIAILHGDDPRVRAMAGRCRGRVVSYGLDPSNDVSASEVTTEALAGTSFWLNLGGERLFVKVPLVGGHAVELALAGFATGHALGLHIAEMLPGFDDPAIQVRLLVSPGPRGSRIIDDTYNASTPSVLSALGLLESLGPRRAIVVLGEMREMGELAAEEHKIVGRRAGEVADLVVTYGELARIIAAEAATVAGRNEGRPPTVISFGLEQRDELVRFLQRELQAGDVVLLKGSRGLRMEEIVEVLRADAGLDRPGEMTDSDGQTAAQ